MRAWFAEVVPRDFAEMMRLSSGVAGTARGRATFEHASALVRRYHRAMISHRVTLGLAILMVAAPTHAGLGGDAASIATDSVALGGSHEITHAAGFEVHVLRLPSGTTVREYTTRGKVFAVAWGGPAIPDLRRLLGTYFDAYVKSPQGRATGHHHLRVVSTRDWVVQSAGHQNGFVGRAWLSTNLPEHFDLDTVRAW